MGLFETGIRQKKLPPFKASWNKIVAFMIPLPAEKSFAQSLHDTNTFAPDTLD